MSAMVNHGARIEGDDDPDCPNCRGQGTIIALWNYIDTDLVTEPGAANLWTGDSTRSDLMLDLDNGPDNDLPDITLPDELTNHGQSNPEKTVEPDPRQAFHTALVEQTTDRGRRNMPIYHQKETPTNSRAESVWGTPDSQNSGSVRPGRNSTSSYRAVPRSRSVGVHCPQDLPPSSFIVLPSTKMLMSGPCQKGHHLRTFINHDEVDLGNVYHSETRLLDDRPFFD